MHEDGFFIIDMGAEKLPERKHPEDMGMDVYAPFDFTVLPHASQDILLGFGTVMPTGFAAFIKPRGSMGLLGLYPVDNPIDSNYRGENHAVVWNLSDCPIKVNKGDRFCQLVIVPCVLGDIPVINKEDAPPSDRGTGGYGSTGR